MYIGYFGLESIADTSSFSNLDVNDQKLILFITSLVKTLEILILDEAFSGMEFDSILLCHKLLDQ